MEMFAWIIQEFVAKTFRALLILTLQMPFIYKFNGQ